jgi:hypothetical protein
MPHQFGGNTRIHQQEISSRLDIDRMFGYVVDGIYDACNDHKAFLEQPMSDIHEEIL